MRVGILTHYYQSQNYGGNLQAWALCKAIRKMGYDVCQIQYDRRDDISIWANPYQAKTQKLKNFIRPLLRSIKSIVSRDSWSNKELLAYKKALLDFNSKAIPHSEKLYSRKSLETLGDDFDVFITGSDQVWHPSAVCDAYLLNFANGKNIPKFSYAASISKNELSEKQRTKYQSCLQEYQGVSVRENSAVELLQQGVNLKIVTSLDPTMILEIEDWNEIIEPVLVQEKYLFCYLLGSDEQQRKLVRNYADLHHLKIVTLRFVGGNNEKNVQHFSDYSFYDVSPGKWLSLIKNAEFVFTDSFHATVFSLLFKKQFVVVPRNGYSEMSVRIISLLDLFDAPGFFLTDQYEKIPSNLERLPVFDYERRFAKFENMKNKSLKYLEDQLCLASRRLNETK